MRTVYLKLLHRGSLWLATALLAGVLIFGAASANANPTFSQQDAIALAVQHPAFADGLAAHPNWTAAAYNTHNSYGIWRVQFWDAGGNDLGWADVSLERGRVYSWESYTDSTPQQDIAAQDAVEQFVRSHPDVLELLPSLTDDHDIYIDYDGWNDYWGVWVDAGQDSLWLTVRFEGGQPSSLENPTLEGIYFPFVVSYDEWNQASQSEAVSLAFQQPEIAAAVRGYDSWQTAVESAGDDLWTVYFKHDDVTLAQAAVSTVDQQVLDFTVFMP